MRNVIIGLDGVPYELILDLTEKNIMPNFKRLLEIGTLAKMESCIPEISSSSWSSIITGKNIAEHGIFGFIDLIEKTYTLCFPNFSSLKEKPFWHDSSKKHIIINVPSTYPAKELNGYLVAGFVALDLEKASYPKSFVEELKEMDYQIDVDSEKAHISKILFLKDLFDNVQKRSELIDKMWDRCDWKNFMYVITETDRIGHFLWDAYVDVGHKHHKDFLNFFSRVDEVIGKIVSKMNPDDNLIMLSDHGMELTDWEVNINSVLREKGYLSLGKDLSQRYNNILPETKAFALDPSRIYLNKKGKYPSGHVEKQDEEIILNEIMEIFKNLDKDGRKVIKRVYRKEEIYHGPYLEKAPDLVLLSEPGFNLRGNLDEEGTFTKKIFTGKHTQENAFLFVNTKQKVIPKNLSVFKFLEVLNNLENLENGKKVP
jgi:predicted AlkP superfamily phosphohydrolase/phosphomutase